MIEREFLELVRLCEELLAPQDQLIATFKKSRLDTSEALRLRTQITTLIDNIHVTMRSFERSRLN